MGTSRKSSHSWFLAQFEGLFNANNGRVISLGTSEEGRPLFAYQWGRGGVKWMAWSQMHGDEFSSTHTLLQWMKNLFELPGETLQNLGDSISLTIIPVVNPDGLERATRVNSKGIDLNRDFNELRAVESEILRNQIAQFKPDLCFNMHDQRSIFQVDGKSAAGSILVPFSSSEKLQNDPWNYAAERAGKLVELLRRDSSDFALGKYADDFYPEAFGDNLMARGIPNILVECGFAGALNRMDVVKWWADALTQLALLTLPIQMDHAHFIPSYESVPFMTKDIADLVCLNEDGRAVLAFILVPSRQCDVHFWEFQALNLQELSPNVKGRFTWAYSGTSTSLPIEPSEIPQNTITTLRDPSGRDWHADELAALI